LSDVRVLSRAGIMSALARVMTRPWTPLGRLMAMDPDLYGPPEWEPDDPPQEDDWGGLLDCEHGYIRRTCRECLKAASDG